MDLAAIDEAIRVVHRDRRWILVPDAAAAATRLVHLLREDGASGVMVVSATEGVGDLPDADRIHYTRTSGDSIMAGLRAFIASIEEPSDEMTAAVDAFDPTGEARVLGQGFSREHRLAGRPVYGRRPRAWRDLEDKTTVDDLWDAAGIERAPSIVVPVEDAAAASVSVASNEGTVWVADNRTGWHGGGEYTRWAPPGSDLDDLARWFSSRARRVRVMPFLEGIPCSIHGFVTHDGVAVFAPLELFILRRRDRPSFEYAQGANFWDPPSDITAEMRRAAGRVGDHLRRRHGYLGGFGIDGVATIDGFRPTELNPRMTLGHFVAGRSSEIPLGPAERLLLEGDIELSAAEIEDHVLTRHGTTRGGGMAFFPSGTRDPETVMVRFSAEGAEITDDEDAATARMSLGPAASGAIVMVELDPERVPTGPPLAPRAAQLMALAGDHWDLDLPDVEAAPNPFG